MFKQESWISVFIFLSVLVGITLACFIIRSLIFRGLNKWAARTESRLDDLIIASCKLPSLFWCLAIGLYVAIGTSSLPASIVSYAFVFLNALVIISVTLVAANLAAKLVIQYAEKAQLDIPVTGLSRTITRGLILLLGSFILLSSLGLSITPLITALGIGGLAVALALQDTLANLFAGIHILVEKPIRMGDYIKLQSGEEGYVVDIGWRTTRIRMLPNNMIIIPNSKLSQTILTNYYLPETRMALLIPIGVSYSSDPEKVEQILVEEAKKAVGEVPGLLGDPSPFVRFIPGFGESSLDFTLICQVAEFVDQYLVQHELRKRIFKRFKEEGIEIPFPHRTVYLRQERKWE